MASLSQYVNPNSGVLGPRSIAQARAAGISDADIQAMAKQQGLTIGSAGSQSLSPGGSFLNQYVNSSTGGLGKAAVDRAVAAGYSPGLIQSEAQRLGYGIGSQAQQAYYGGSGSPSSAGGSGSSSQPRPSGSLLQYGGNASGTGLGRAAIEKAMADGWTPASIVEQLRKDQMFIGPGADSLLHDPLKFVHPVTGQVRDNMWTARAPVGPLQQVEYSINGNSTMRGGVDSLGYNFSMYDDFGGEGGKYWQGAHIGSEGPYLRPEWNGFDLGETTKWRGTDREEDYIRWYANQTGDSYEETASTLRGNWADRDYRMSIPGTWVDEDGDWLPREQQRTMHGQPVLSSSSRPLQTGSGGGAPRPPKDSGSSGSSGSSSSSGGWSSQAPERYRASTAPSMYEDFLDNYKPPTPSDSSGSDNSGGDRNKDDDYNSILSLYKDLGDRASSGSLSTR